jgi:hypothetical protein
VLKGGKIVYAGGTVTAPVISSGGSVGIAAGVKVTGLTVGNGVTLFVSTGATASAAHVLKGGEIVYAGGKVIAPVFAAGGREGIAGGVKVTGLTVGKGVTLFVSSGATASNTVLASGSEIVSAGGIVGGTVKFGAHSSLTMAAKTSLTLKISGFAATDTLDLAGYAFGAKEKLSFKENATKTQGTLTITDGALHATITLFGQYVAAGFQHVSDGAAGTAIHYAAPPVAHLELAGTHG